MLEVWVARFGPANPCAVPATMDHDVVIKPPGGRNHDSILSVRTRQPLRSRRYPRTLTITRTTKTTAVTAKATIATP